MAESYPIAQLLAETQRKRADEGLNPGPFHNLFTLEENDTISTALHLATIATAVANAPTMGIDAQKLISMTLKELFARIPLRDAVTLSVKLPVLEAIVALTGNHRIIVTDPDDDDKHIGLLSQMDIVRFLVRHWDQVPRAVRDEKVEQLMTRNPHTVNENAPVRAALQLLGHESVSGIGIINDESALVANFSIADLRVLVALSQRTPPPESLPELINNESVKGFLRKTKGHIAPKDLLAKELILADPSTPLEDAAKQMLAHHVHRMYILDGKGKPVGVLSTTDVCVYLAKALGKKGAHHK